MQCANTVLALDRSKESWNRYNSEDVWNAMCQRSQHGINGDSAGNYHYMDEESIGGMVFRQELLAQRQGTHPRKGIPPGITSLFTWIQDCKIKIRGKFFER
jgi:hypothetical protein